MIPSQNKIEILVKGATSVLLGVKGLNEGVLGHANYNSVPSLRMMKQRQRGETTQAQDGDGKCAGVLCGRSGVQTRSKRPAGSVKHG